MNEFGHWSALEEFSVEEAALLIAKVKPGSVNIVKFQRSDDRYADYYSARKLLIEAILSSKELREKICYSRMEIDPALVHPVNRGKGTPNWEKTKFTKEEYREICRDKGIKSEFFSTSGLPGYLDPDHTHYAHKLAAVVNAWLAVEGTADEKEEKPKDLLENWLKEHHKQYKGLTNVAGRPMKTTIEDCAKVANWEPEGGRPKKKK